MRYRYAVLLLAFAAVAFFAGRRLFYPAVSLHAATLSSTPAQSYLVIWGVYSTSGDRVISFSRQDPAAQKGKTSYYYVRGVQQTQPGQVGGQIV